MQMPEDVQSPTTERHQPDYDSLNRGMASLVLSGQNCGERSFLVSNLMDLFLFLII
jgi:hypothetical protein